MAVFNHQKWHKFLAQTLLSNLDKHRLGIIIIKRWYSQNTSQDWNKLRPMIKKRIANRAGDYPINAMIPIAQEVLQARSDLINGVSSLLTALPAVTCKFCPEVYIGETGHLIKTCRGFKSRNKNQVHRWISASLNDICVPVETFHLENMSQDIIKHHQRFDFERVPAVVELCWQAGAGPHDLDLQALNNVSESMVDAACNEAHALSSDELRSVANRTLRAWEILREGVQKLLFAYPVKVCKHCSEVHVGPSGHKARLCGLFKYQRWRGTHFWEKARVDDLVPPNIVWHRRPQDPPTLVDEGRDYYGHAPAVVDLCSKAGIVIPSKYFCLMKVQGLTVPSS